MDSLLANYASSDEEEQQQQQQSLPQQKPKSPNPKPFESSSQIPSRKRKTNAAAAADDEDEDDLLSLDNKRSSLFSLPPPKSSSSSSMFSSLPASKASKSNPFNLPPPVNSSEPKPKKVVQFKPPVISSVIDDDDDEEEDDEKEKQRKRSESEMQSRTEKGLLSILPAPMSSGTLGAMPLGSGTGRRSVLEADVPASDSNASSVRNESVVDSNVGYYEEQYAHAATVSSSGAVDGVSQYEYPQWGTQGENYANYQSYAGYDNGGGEYSSYGSSYGTYGDYGQYEHNSVDGSVVSSQELQESDRSALRLLGKKGKNDASQQIVEVKQDELIKNRPREDQSKLTGIAFGPAYKPASTKGKPTKLHKRKHQIGSLYFDMRQKESELTERRARGMLTKSQTQGKYGW